MTRSHSAPRAEPAPKRTVLLALGSNIDPEANMLAALDELGSLLEIRAVSAIYEADPVGAPGTPRFLNAAVRVLTDLPLAELKFTVLRPLEARLGRTRGQRPNAPRTIDVDIVAADDLVLEDEGSGIRVPDPDITRRAHLALPLRDVAPAFLHPVTRRSMAEIADGFGEAEGIRRRDDLQWPRP